MDPVSSGVCAEQVMVAEALDISRETYFAILMDRSCNGPVMVGSPQGGVDIEEVAATTPELIFKVSVPPDWKDVGVSWNKLYCKKTYKYTEICYKQNREAEVFVYF